MADTQTSQARKRTPGQRPGQGPKECPKDTRGTMRRLLQYLSVYRWIILLVIALSVLSNVLALFGPDLAGHAINAAAAGPGKVDFALVWHYARLMLAFYITSAVLSYLISLIMMYVGRWLGRKMRGDVFAKLMRLPVSYFDTNQAGDIISRVSYDIDVVTTSFSTDLVQILTSVVTVIGSLIMMIAISRELSVVTLVTIPLSILYTRWVSRKTRPLYSRRSRAYGRMNGFVEEMFSGQRSILAYAQEDNISDDFDQINQEASDAMYHAEYYGMSTGPTVGFINNLGLSLTCLFGSLLYLFGSISLGQISSFVLYTRKFSGPINEAANIMNEIFSALAAAERVFRLLDETEESADAPDAAILTNVRGDVALSHVNFGYVPGRQILHDVSLRADAGKLIAIVGPTGAGKTTIINLLMRFYDVDSGEIRVDGHETRSLTRKSLRKAWAMVLQDTWVFRGTVFDNIAYGRENATQEEVEAAARAARIDSFIERLPQGYQTVIDEDGGNISKGQKQMLTIARAFLYDARMLILDEATSNVDTQTERQIQAAMRELMRDKTCFVIAHRLSTIQNADTILVVNHGDIVEQGTHAELMQKRGFYYQLYRSQFD